MYVACPNCRGWMVGDGIPVGAAVLCPHCQKQFVMTEAILAAAVQPEANRPVSGDRVGVLKLPGLPLGEVGQPSRWGPVPSLQPRPVGRP
jgi:hypothetical protein